MVHSGHSPQPQPELSFGRSPNLPVLKTEIGNRSMELETGDWRMRDRRMGTRHSELDSSLELNTGAWDGIEFSAVGFVATQALLDSLWSAVRGAREVDLMIALVFCADLIATSHYHHCLLKTSIPPEKVREKLDVIPRTEWLPPCRSAQNRDLQLKRGTECIAGWGVRAHRTGVR